MTTDTRVSGQFDAILARIEDGSYYADYDLAVSSLKTLRTVSAELRRSSSIDVESVKGRLPTVEEIHDLLVLYGEFGSSNSTHHGKADECAAELLRLFQTLSALSTPPLAVQDGEVRAAMSLMTRLGVTKLTWGDLAGMSTPPSQAIDAGSLPVRLKAATFEDGCASESIRKLLKEAAAALTHPAGTVSVSDAPKTIDSAPKNQTDMMRCILIFWKSTGKWHECWWDVDEEFNERPDWWISPEEGWRSWGDKCIPLNQQDATHWLYMPPKPAALSLGGSKE